MQVPSLFLLQIMPFLCYVACYVLPSLVEDGDVFVSCVLLSCNRSYDLLFDVFLMVLPPKGIYRLSPHGTTLVFILTLSTGRCMIVYDSSPLVDV